MTKNHMYIVSTKQKRVGCIALKYIENNDSPFLLIAGSMTSHLDNFSAKTARNIANQRLNSENAKTRKTSLPVSTFREKNNNLCKDIIRKLKLDSLDNENYKTIDWHTTTNKFRNLATYVISQNTNGSITLEAKQSLLQRMFLVVKELNCTLEKDGDKWCYTYNELLDPNCIAGFGDTPEDALIAFYRGWKSKN